MIARCKEQEYIEYQRRNNMFFDEEDDEMLLKFRRKLQEKIERHAELATEVKLLINSQV